MRPRLPHRRPTPRPGRAGRHVQIEADSTAESVEFSSSTSPRRLSEIRESYSCGPPGNTHDSSTAPSWELVWKGLAVSMMSLLFLMPADDGNLGWRECPPVLRDRTLGQRLTDNAQAGSRWRSPGPKDGNRILFHFFWCNRNFGSGTPHAPRCRRAWRLHSHAERIRNRETSERYGADNLSTIPGDRHRNPNNGCVDRRRRPSSSIAARGRKPAHPWSPTP